MSSHSFGSLFPGLRSHSGKLGIRPFIVLCLTRLCKGAKLKIEAGTNLICQHCRDVTGSNAVAFTEDGAMDVRANLFAAEGAVNVEVIENLLYLVCDDREEDKVLPGVTDSSGRKTFLTIFFRHPSL